MLYILQEKDIPLTIFSSIMISEEKEAELELRNPASGIRTRIEQDGDLIGYIYNESTCLNASLLNAGVHRNVLHMPLHPRVNNRTAELVCDQIENLTGVSVRIVRYDPYTLQMKSGKTKAIRRWIKITADVERDDATDVSTTCILARMMSVGMVAACNVRDIPDNLSAWVQMFYERCYEARFYPGIIPTPFPYWKHHVEADIENPHPDLLKYAGQAFLSVFRRKKQTRRYKDEWNIYTSLNTNITLREILTEANNLAYDYNT